MATAHKLAMQEAITTGPTEQLDYTTLLCLLRKRRCHVLERFTDVLLQKLAKSILKDGLGIKDQQKIMKEGVEDETYMWFVYRGSVEVKDMSDNRLLTTIDAGGCFGEYSLVTGKPRCADAFAKGPAVLIKVGSSLVAKLTADCCFLRDLNLERESILEFNHELNGGKNAAHAEVGLLPSTMILPGIQNFLEGTPSSAFAEKIAAYKRLQRLAGKAKIGTGFFFFFFSPLAELRSPSIETDESGLTASKVVAPGALLGRGDLALGVLDGKWGSIMLQPAITAVGQVYVEFHVDMSNSVCELLFGVCDGSQKPATNQVTFKCDNSWMYYSYNGRRYTKGVGYDFVSQTRRTGKRVGQGDRVGILIDQRSGLAVGGKAGARGRCAGVYVNGQLQGTLVTENELTLNNKAWPEKLWIAIDMYGENQRVRILADSCRVAGVSLRVGLSFLCVAGTLGVGL